VAEILGHFKNRVEELRLVPSSGGVFELTDLDGGRTVFSKAAEQRFPDEGELVRRLAPADGGAGGD
jgi:selT/selW/selH-like putative selenoprotein